MKNADHRKYADPSDHTAPSLSPHIRHWEPEKHDSNSINQASAKHIRRLYEGSDIRVCEDCGRNGDRWEMEKHSLPNLLTCKKVMLATKKVDHMF